MLVGAKAFSKLDVNARYSKVPLWPEFQELTTSITPMGRFMFRRLPFGISTAPELFQRERLRILERIHGQVYHMDDMFVFGENKSQHNKTINEVLRKLTDTGVTLNAKKCELARPK